MACPRFLVAQVQVAKPGNDYENMRWDKVDVRPLQIIEQADGAVCKGRSISLGLKRTACIVTPDTETAPHWSSIVKPSRL